MKKSIELFLVLIIAPLVISGCSSLKTGNPATQTAQAESIALTAVAEAMAFLSQTNEAMSTITIRPEQSNQPTISPTAAPTEVTIISSQTAAAPVAQEPQNLAQFVSETIEDGTIIDAGAKFTKTWVLRNSGSSAWTASYLLVFVHGDQMGSPNWTQIGQQVLAGEEISLSVTLTAPVNPGTYAGYWKLSDPNGNIFGVEPNGTGAFYVQIVVPYDDTKTPTSTVVSTSTETPMPDTQATEPLDGT